jgi:hypothetical protein
MAETDTSAPRASSASFSSAIAYFKDYRQAREDALDNTKRARWFTSETDSLDNLIDDEFDSRTENSDWESLYDTAGTGHLQMQSVRMKIAFIVGCRHDLREQFAIGENNEPKTILDFDRHAVNEVRAAQYRLDILEQAVATQALGVTTIDTAAPSTAPVSA